MSDEPIATSTEAAKLARQYGVLPARWAAFDRIVVATTELLVAAIGMAFALMLSVEVASRYLLNHSLSFVDGAARFLLLWFFLLGVGLAMRYGAHVGVELLVNSVPPKLRRYLIFVSQVFGLIFILEMVWSGYAMLGLAAAQIDASLEISMFWGFLAIPIGFALLAYHTIIMMVVGLRSNADSEART